MADSPSMDKEKLLGQSFILQPLDPLIRRELASVGFPRRVAGGDRIFSAGDPGLSMMAIAEGMVRISALAPTARDVVLADLSKGDVFGEIAMLDGGPRSADAQALTNCTLVVLERRAFLEVMRRHPEVAELLLKILCSRVRRADERMMDIGFLALPSRLAKALLHATESSRGPDTAPAKRLSLSQSEIANMVGSSRENVNRHLKRWQGEGLIDLRDGWIVILDRAGLEAQTL